MTPTTAFIIGYLSATILGFLAGIDALLRAGKNKTHITTIPQAARWWFYRNPGE